MGVERYIAKLLYIITDLIESKGVTQFYSGFRGDFDRFCSSLIYELKANYSFKKTRWYFLIFPTKILICQSVLTTVSIFWKGKFPNGLP